MKQPECHCPPRFKAWRSHSLRGHTRITRSSQLFQLQWHRPSHPETLWMPVPSGLGSSATQVHDYRPEPKQENMQQPLALAKKKAADEGTVPTQRAPDRVNAVPASEENEKAWSPLSCHTCLGHGMESPTEFLKHAGHRELCASITRTEGSAKDWVQPGGRKPSGPTTMTGTQRQRVKK